MELKFKTIDSPIVISEDWWYMLYDGGYIKPFEILEEDDAKKLQNAIDFIAKVIEQGEEKGIFDTDY